MFEDYDRVLVMCDGDQAGRDFGKKLAGEIDGATIINLPEGSDVNDIYMAEGSDGIKERIGLLAS